MFDGEGSLGACSLEGDLTVSLAELPRPAGHGVEPAAGGIGPLPPVDHQSSELQVQGETPPLLRGRQLRLPRHLAPLRRRGPGEPN